MPDKKVKIKKEKLASEQAEAKKILGDALKGGSGVPGAIETKEEMKDLFLPIVRNSWRFKIVDYIFGRNDLSTPPHDRNWQSITDLVQMIHKIKKGTHAIEIHTCCDPRLKKTLINYVRTKMPVGCRLKLHSWKHTGILRKLDGRVRTQYLRGFQPGFSPQPHKRMLLCESIGVSLDSGFNYGQETGWRMLSLDKIKQEREWYTPPLPDSDSYYTYDWKEDISK